MSQKDIAAAIGVSPSTITRELKRNSGSRSKYNWNTAQSNATYHKHRHPGNHAVKAEIKTEVISLLVTKQWSPDKYPAVWRWWARIFLMRLYTR